MKRTFIIILFALSMLLVLGHAMVPHSHFFKGKVGFSAPAKYTFADLLKATFSHDLGTDHLRVFKSCKATCQNHSTNQDVLASPYYSSNCKRFSLITTEKVTVFPPLPARPPQNSTGPLRAPPIQA